MLELFPERSDDLLDVAALPSTENTELNYRTRPLKFQQEISLTLLLLMVPVPLALLGSVAPHLLTTVSPWMDDMAYAGGFVLALWFLARRLTRAIFRWEVLVGSAFLLCSTGELFWGWAMHGGLSTRVFAFVTTWITCALMGRQVAAWILVAPTVDYEKMQRWKMNLPQLIPHGLSRDCPELLTYSVSPILVVCSWIIANHFSTESATDSWYWPFRFTACGVCVWLLWHLIARSWLPWPGFTKSWRCTFHALLVFLTYNVYDTPAAGVFRFPTRWLRRPWPRWGLFIFTLVAISFSYATTCPSPVVILREEGLFMGPLLLNFLLCCLTGPLVLIVTLWLSVGTLLARFDAELSTCCDDSNSEWDNYVDRIINSNDKLEREHILLGVSESGDYPILVHREIHDQHGHILGDTGASKTALGFAPQVTQKIARGDSTVVVIDLKGDKALFETCRLEAARTKKMRFRWITNEIGRSSFCFNPLMQSHNQFLSVEQLAQELLQGLALDYGLGYGASYFTAMNETVMTNIVGATGARSFRELNERLNDRRWYADRWHDDDWKQARHLVALVKKLAGSPSLNLVPGMYPDQPEVHEQAIDVANLLEEPQVVYLSLRSPLEAANAPTIARLFLWTMFTAAAHQPQDQNRVYFFIDEMQQIVGDGIKLIFEQFRDLGGTIIGAHQTAGQLRRQGTDLGDTIDSCTAIKQVFRASDLNSLDRIEKLSGVRREIKSSWYQPYERGTGDLTRRYDPLLADEGMVRAAEEERPRYDRNELLAISSRRQSSLVRFTFGSGYTQFAGATIPMKSSYHISQEEYQRRRRLPWPTAPGAIILEPFEHPAPVPRVKPPRKRRSKPKKSTGVDHAQVERVFLEKAKSKKKPPKPSE